MLGAGPDEPAVQQPVRHPDRRERAGTALCAGDDLIESDTHYILRADLPGLSEDDVNIELDGNVLSVSGERKSEHEHRGQGYYRVERSYGSFRRSLRLPEGVDAGAIKATFDKGVLEITVPKPEAAKPHKVQITVSADESQAIEGGESTETAPSSAAEHGRSVSS